MLLTVVFFVIKIAVLSETKAYTPYYISFKSDMSLNLTSIALQAKLASDEGVNLVWVNGGMSQFQALTLSERKTVAEEWVKEGQKYGIPVLVHITDLSVDNSKHLAHHARDIGADFIATLPPFYQKPAGVAGIIEWINAVSEGVDLPLFYYHIPGSTGVEIDVFDLVQQADAQVKNFHGVKYVDSHDTIWKFEKCLTFKDGKYAKGMMWANEPKLAAFPFGARSVVLAEIFYAKFYNQMTALWDSGQVDKAFELQKWIQDVHQIVSIGGGKNVLRHWDIWLGPNRLPSHTKSEADINEMMKQLKDIGFFD